MGTFLRGARPVAVVLAAVLLYGAGAADDGSAGDLTVRAEAPADATASVRAEAPAEAGTSHAGASEAGGHDAEAGGHDAHG